MVDYKNVNTKAPLCERLPAAALALLFFIVWVAVMQIIYFVEVVL